jgi:REP element-mobilizing transposase RayT
LLYHVIARGNHRQPIFLDDGDYEAYLWRLAQYRNRYGLALYAYCLMPNHLHLLVQTSDVPLAKFMQGLQQSYTLRFNRAYGKVGHLFQGRYKAIVCERDEYLVTLVRYIHLNPVRARLVDDPAAYPYSGHRAYMSRDDGGLVDRGPVLALLGGRAGYQRFVLAGLAEGHEERYYQTEDQQFLGAQGFAQRVGQDAQRAGTPPTRPLAMVMDELAAELDLHPRALRGRDRTHSITRARALVSFVLVRRLGYRVADVATALGRDAATISVMVSRVAHRLRSRGSVGLSTEMFRSQSLTPGKLHGYADGGGVSGGVEGRAAGVGGGRGSCR